MENEKGKGSREEEMEKKGISRGKGDGGRKNGDKEGMKEDKGGQEVK